MNKMQLREEQIKRISLMKNPIIYMNNKDFNGFIEELKSEICNFNISSNPTYCGVPVKTGYFLGSGSIIIIDDVYNLLK